MEPVIHSKPITWEAGLDLGMSITAEKIRLQMASWDPTSRLVSNGCTLVISPFGVPFHTKGYSG